MKPGFVIASGEMPEGLTIEKVMSAARKLLNDDDLFLKVVNVAVDDETNVNVSICTEIDCNLAREFKVLTATDKTFELALGALLKTIQSYQEKVSKLREKHEEASKLVKLAEEAEEEARSDILEMVNKIREKKVE